MWGLLFALIADKPAVGNPGCHLATTAAQALSINTPLFSGNFLF
jgi:hypothetical protein